MIPGGHWILCPRKESWTQKLSVAAEGRRRGPYQRHSLDFKRAVVEETLAPGASVARIARIHGLNANQVFAWRKAYREGDLAAAEPALLPVRLADTRTCDAGAKRPAASEGVLILECGPVRLRIEGRPDAETLRLVLMQLLP